MTYQDDGAEALPDERVRAHARHVGLIGFGSPYAAPGYGGHGGVGGVGVGGGGSGFDSAVGGGGVGGGTGGGGGIGCGVGSGAGMEGGLGGLDRESSSSSTSTSSDRPTLSISMRDLTPRHLPLPALKSSFNAFQPLSRPHIRRVDTEPLSHSLSSAGHALSGLSIKSEILSAPPLSARPHSASSYAAPVYSAQVYYDGYYWNGYGYPYQQEYYAQSYDVRRSERGMETPIPTAAAAKVEP